MGNDIGRLRTIHQYCCRIENKIREAGEDEDEFVYNLDLLHLCSFYVLQIGECIKSLSPELTKKYPEIPWRELSGMRDIIAHGYERIDHTRIWFTVIEEIPLLKTTCERILKELSP